MNRWDKANKSRPCPKCGKCNRCTIAPDGTAGICWRNGGKLWNDKAGTNGNGTHGTGYVGKAHRPKPEQATKNGKHFATAAEAIHAAVQLVKGGKFAQAWDYHDASGAHVLSEVRIDTPDGKEFRPVHLSKSGWVIGGMKSKAPLYCLPDVIAASKVVIVTEGAKCADAVRSLDLPATTSCSGALAAEKTDWTPLARKHVIILQDNDDAGRQYGREVAAICETLGSRVKRVDIPGAAEGGDVADWTEERDDKDTDEIRAELIAIIDATPIDPEPFTFHTAAQFDALDLRRDYHIPGILSAGGVPTVLAGSFKTLKTSIAADLLVSLATGSSFLGHFRTTRAIPVAMMSGESGGFALQSLIRRVAHSKGWAAGSIGDNLRICSNVLNLTAQADLSFIERFIDSNGIQLFAIDPTYLAMRGLRSDDAGSLFAMAAHLEPLSRIGERTGCTMLIVHHNSRGATRTNPGEPAELADIAWSGFAEWAGQWLLLSRRERFDPDSDGEHRLWLTAGGRDGHSNLVGVNVVEGRSDDPNGRRWSVSVEQASHVRRADVESQQDRREQDRQTRREKQLEQDRAAVRAAMNSTGETKTSIRDRAGLRGDRFNAAFATLLADGTVEACEISKGNNRKYDGYRLHQDASGRNGTHRGQSSRPGAVASETDAPPIGGRPDALLPEHSGIVAAGTNSDSE